MKRKSHEDFLRELVSINSNIEILSEYKNNRSKIKCKCRKCNTFWDGTPSKLLIGQGCPKCAKNHKKSHKEFIEDMKLVNPDIEILTTYININTKVQCRCKIDGYTWMAIPHNLLLGKGCPECKKLNISNKFTKSHNQFISELNEVNPNIEALCTYAGSQTKMPFRCKIDGNIWYATPDNILHKSGCPVCSESKGEKRILSFLESNNIVFERQKSFDGLLGVANGLLTYDFYLPNNNILIEYQGIQHKKPIDFNGQGIDIAQLNFKKQKEHDRRKRSYAHNNSIELLEIWYKDFNNIEAILKNLLNLT